MARGSFSQNGDVINYKNNGSTELEYNEVVVIGGSIGVVEGLPIPVGETGTLAISKIYALPAETTAAFAVGDVVYWDVVGEVVTATAGSIVAGMVVAPKAAADAAAYVKIG